MIHSIDRLHYLAQIRGNVPVHAIWSELWLDSLIEADAQGRKQARHKMLIRLACELGGWQDRRWKKGILRELKTKRPKHARNWKREVNEIYEFMEKMPCVPDAWRIRREGRREGWGHGVFVIELLEVDVSHCMSPVKEDWYEAFWWDADASEYIDVRIWRMNRNGFVSPLMADLGEYQISALERDLSRWTRGFTLDSSAAA